MKIEDSIAVITGASSGAGQALSLQLARRNIHGLALVDQHPPPLRLTAVINQRAHDSLYLDFHGDLADGEFRRRVYRETRDRCGTVNICVSLPSVPHTADISKRVKTGLVDPLLWAREMVAGIAAARRRKDFPRRHIPEPLQGIIILVIPEIVKRREAEHLSFDLKARLKNATRSLSMDARHNGVGCEVLSSHENPLLDLRVQASGASRQFSSIRIGGNAPPQALSEAICAIIEDAIGEMCVPG